MGQLILNPTQYSTNVALYRTHHSTATHHRTGDSTVTHHPTKDSLTDQHFSPKCLWPPTNSTRLPIHPTKDRTQHTLPQCILTHSVTQPVLRSPVQTVESTR